MAPTNNPLVFILDRNVSFLIISSSPQITGIPKRQSANIGCRQVGGGAGPSTLQRVLSEQTPTRLHKGHVCATNYWQSHVIVYMVTCIFNHGSFLMLFCDIPSVAPSFFLIMSIPQTALSQYHHVFITGRPFPISTLMRHTASPVHLCPYLNNIISGCVLPTVIQRHSCPTIEISAPSPGCLDGGLQEGDHVAFCRVKDMVGVSCWLVAALHLRRGTRSVREGEWGMLWYINFGGCLDTGCKRTLMAFQGVKGVRLLLHLCDTVVVVVLSYISRPPVASSFRVLGTIGWYSKNHYNGSNSSFNVWYGSPELLKAPSKGPPQTASKVLLEFGLAKLFRMEMTVSTHTKRKNALWNSQVTTTPSVTWLTSCYDRQEIMVRERREKTDFANCKGMKLQRDECIV